MKRIISLLITLTLVFTLAGCWAGEVSVDTTFEKDGSGTRTIVLAVMDDTLSTTPITNPDDPDGTEGKGAVINNQHITGGIAAIYTWLDDNAPTWMTVEAMTTEGVTRYFELSYTFTSFEDFLAKYEELVDLSPSAAWADFTADELPTFECEGLFTNACTFNESIDLVNASLDWAVDGIWTDIYDESTLAGYVTKADISVLSSYKVTLGGEVVEEVSAFDPDAVDGEGTGKVLYPTGPTWEVVGEFPNTTAYIITAVIAVVVVAGGVLVVIKKK